MNQPILLSIGPKFDWCRKNSIMINGMNIPIAVPRLPYCKKITWTNSSGMNLTAKIDIVAVIIFNIVSLSPKKSFFFIVT